jgi:hypothetical protein
MTRQPSEHYKAWHPVNLPKILNLVFGPATGKQKNGSIFARRRNMTKDLRVFEWIKQTVNNFDKRLTFVFFGRQKRLGIAILPSPIAILIVLLLDTGPSLAESLHCSTLIRKPPPSEFVVPVPADQLFTTQLKTNHATVTESSRLQKMRNFLYQISSEGLITTDPTSGNELKIARKQLRRFILEFRKDTSILRSFFYFLKKRTPEQKDFNNFVRDFGILKDYVIMDDELGARKTAALILQTYSTLDYAKLTEAYTLRTQKQFKKYLSSIIATTQSLLTKISAPESITIHELHQVRKNLRDLLRVMQMQGKSSADPLSAPLADPAGGPGGYSDYSYQISYLQNLNSRLGDVCDNNAARILRGEITKHNKSDFPANDLEQKLKDDIQYFLDHLILKK